MERGEHVTYSGAQNEVEGMAKLKIANVDQNWKLNSILNQAYLSQFIVRETLNWDRTDEAAD